MSNNLYALIMDDLFFPSIRVTMTDGLPFHLVCGMQVLLVSILSAYPRFLFTRQFRFGNSNDINSMVVVSNDSNQYVFFICLSGRVGMLDQK